MSWEQRLPYHHAVSRIARAAVSAMVLPGFVSGGPLQFFCIGTSVLQLAHGAGPNSEDGKQGREGEVVGDSATEITRKEDVAQMK